MTEIPKPTYTEYALLVRCESAKYRVARLRKALEVVIETEDQNEARKIARDALASFPAP